MYNATPKAPLNKNNYKKKTKKQFVPPYKIITNASEPLIEENN